MIRARTFVVADGHLFPKPLTAEGIERLTAKGETALGEALAAEDRAGDRDGRPTGKTALGEGLVAEDRAGDR